MEIALIQYDIKWLDHVSNLKVLDTLIPESSFDILILPEMFTTGFLTNPTELKIEQQNIALEWMQQISTKHQALVIGSIPYIKEKKYYNRAFAVNPNKQNFSYDKQKLFTLAEEDKYYAAGLDDGIFEWKEWKIMLRICYDLRFPEIARNTQDYDLLIYMASWPMSRIHHWNALLQARAVENQVYTIGVNRIGMDGNGIVYNGNSSIHDFNGRLMLDAQDLLGSFRHTLDYASQKEYRFQKPFLRDI